MYYQLKFRFNIGTLSLNEAKDRIAKIISIQGNSDKRKTEIKMLALQKFVKEEQRQGINSVTIKIRFDISDKTLQRLQQGIPGIQLIGSIPIFEQDIITANQKSDNEFYSIKTKI